MYSKGNGWTPIQDSTEFVDRATAMKFLNSTKDTLTSDVYLVRKEVSLFNEKHVFDISTK
jgi:hypothetical protein